MNILHISHTYPLDAESGVTPFVHQIAREAANQGHDVHVLVPEHDDLDVSEFPEVTVHTFSYSEQRSIEYHAVSDDTADISPVEAVKFTHHCARAVHRLHRQHDFDVLHAHWAVPAGVPAAVVSRLRRLPLVVHTHGRDVYNIPEIGYDIPSHLGARLAIRFALRSADHVIANSRDCRAYGTELGASEENSTVLPFGVDQDKFRPARADPDFRPDEDGTFIVYVGRLVERKGVQDLIAAVKQCDANVQLSIIGAGEYREELEEQANGADNIGFLGFLEHDLLARYMATADIVAVPSRIEPFGIVNIEALAAGTPVIGADTGGIAEILDDDIGRLFPPGDVTALAAVITELADDDDLREQLGKNARDRAEKRYTWERFGERLDDIYRSV